MVFIHIYIIGAIILNTYNHDLFTIENIVYIEKEAFSER